MGLVKSVKRRLQRLIGKHILRQIDDRIGPIETGWRQHMPAFLNAVSTVGAFGEELASLRRDHDRTRAELDQLAADTRGEIERLLARIARLQSDSGAGRFQALDQPVGLRGATGLRLNLGGMPIGQGYLGVGPLRRPGVDIVAEPHEIPLDHGSVSEIVVGDLLDHLSEAELRDRLLPHWRALLGSGGTLRLATLNGRALLDAVKTGDRSFADVRAILFGASNGRRDLFTPEALSELIRGAGFHTAEVAPQAEGSNGHFAFEIRAVRD